MKKNSDKSLLKFPEHSFIPKVLMIGEKACFSCIVCNQIILKNQLICSGRMVDLENIFGIP
jgi:hypothetical protein